MSDQHPDVVATDIVARRPGFSRDDEDVLAIDVAHIDRVTPLARQARQLSDYPVGYLACFNVDFSREFRYCLETGVDPAPASELSTLRLSVPVTETSNDVYGALAVAGDTVTGSPTDILTAVQGGSTHTIRTFWSARRARSSRPSTRWRWTPASMTSR